MNKHKTISILKNHKSRVKKNLVLKSNLSKKPVRYNEEQFMSRSAMKNGLRQK